MLIADWVYWKGRGKGTAVPGAELSAAGGDGGGGCSSCSPRMPPCPAVQLSVCLSVRLSGAKRLHKRGPQGGSRWDLGETWGEAGVSQPCGMPGPWRARARWAVRFGVTQGGTAALSPLRGHPPWACPPLT